MHIQHRTLLVGVQVDEIEPHCSGTVFLALGCKKFKVRVFRILQEAESREICTFKCKYLPPSLIPISPSISQTRPACRCPSIPAKVGPASQPAKGTCLFAEKCLRTADADRKCKSKVGRPADADQTTDEFVDSEWPQPTHPRPSATNEEDLAEED